MERDFEKFEGGPTISPRDRIHVTINRIGVIGFNNRLYSLMGKPEAVSLLYSRTRDMIGIVPASPRFNSSFPVKTGNGTGWRINAAPFLRHFGVKIDSTLRFIAPQLEGTELSLKLSHTVCAAMVPGRGKKRVDRKL